MIIKHKVQRKLDPTFQAALRICILCGPTTLWQRVVCAGSGDGPWRWLSGAHLPGDAPAGSGAGWSSAPLASSGWRCAAPWDLALFGVMQVGTLGPLVLGLSIPPPSLQALHRRGPKRISQNPAFTLPASELLLVLFSYLRLLCPRLRIWESMEKPTTMQTHEGLFTNSSFCPSMPDTEEQGLGPRVGFCLVLRAGLGNLQKG